MAREEKIQPTKPLDFEAYVWPLYHGEPTHPDASRLIVPLHSLTRDPENARLHPEKNVRHIRASLRRRGQQTPIVVDRAGKILKGNGTHEAAEEEGWTHVWIVVSALEGGEATGYAISDNASGLSSAWDFEQLASNVGSLKEEFDGTELEFSNDDLGFEEHDISPFLAADWTPPSAQESGNGSSSETDAAGNNKERAGSDPHENLEAGDKASDDCSIICTPNQRLIINQAIERIRLICGESSLTEGRCMELIAADFIANPHLEEGLK